jgi:glyoxylase-like metal-dependent hydrolase (beta-lactamase superfamily II)
MPYSIRWTTIRVLLLCSAGAIASADAPQGFTVQSLGGGVHLLQGFDCNIVASTGDDGIIMVDTCTAESSGPLLEALRQLSSKSLLFVINTHVHSDHTGGNAYFQKHAPIIAASSVRTWLATGNDTTGDKPSPITALPVITFDGEISLYLNGEDVRILKIAPAHTDGDTIVILKNANVVAMGDVFMSPAVSFGDRHYGGGMIRLIAALEVVVPQIPADAKVIPGHGKVSTRADVVRGLEVLKQMKAVVEDAIRAGKTLEQLTSERPFDKWKSAVPEWRSSDRSMDGLVRNFHRELVTSP